MPDSNNRPQAEVRFSPGQLVHHELFDYRGVVVDVDASFGLSEEWYETMARSRPPRDQPWYHLLVHGSNQMTYVAQRNLEPDATGQPIEHPMLDRFFRCFVDGRYLPDAPIN